ncbi:hypothetical protein WH47_00944, partial [Habropoda laboriosa]
PLVYPRNKLQSQITESNSFGVSRGMSQFQVCQQGFSGRGDFFHGVAHTGTQRSRGKMENSRPGKKQ